MPSRHHPEPHHPEPHHPEPHHPEPHHPEPQHPEPQDDPTWGGIRRHRATSRAGRHRAATRAAESRAEAARPTDARPTDARLTEPAPQSGTAPHPVAPPRYAARHVARPGRTGPPRPRRTTRPIRAFTAVAFGIATAGVISAAVTPPQQTAGQTVSAPSAEQRELAAERADRSARTAPAAPGDQRPGLTAPSATGHKPPAKRPKQKRPAWVNPMAGVPLSSCFGPRWGVLHAGLDFAGPAGRRIRAAGKGEVVSTGWRYPGYGISVLIDHGNGYLTHYAHASRVLVRVGQVVRAGQAIAVEGSTGNSTGPHLHFEVHKGLWNQVDPATWLRRRGVRLGC
jgi:hypothetical protein